MSQSNTNCVTYTGASQTKAMTILAIGIQQWGRTGSISGDTTKTITYPVAYTSAFYSIALVAADNASDWNAEISGTPSTSSVTIIVRGKQRSNVYWIALGKQQWGYRKVSTNASTSLNISYSSSHYVVLISFANNAYGDRFGACYLSATSLTKNSWSLNYADTVMGGGYNWLSIGFQQWGYATRNSLTTFPIAFQTIYGAVATQTGSYSGAYALVSSTLNATQVKFESNKVDNIRYLAYGKQQWGYNSNNAASAVTSFPISYPSACYGIVHCSGSTGRVEGNPWISSISISQFTWGQYGLGYWFSLGRQQWGTKAQGASQTVSYPVSFSDIYSLTTCVWAGQAVGGDYGTAGSVGKSSFKTFCGEPLGWIATGK